MAIVVVVKVAAALFIARGTHMYIQSNTELLCTFQCTISSLFLYSNLYPSLGAHPVYVCPYLLAYFSNVPPPPPTSSYSSLELSQPGSRSSKRRPIIKEATDADSFETLLVAGILKSDPHHWP